MRFGSHFGPTLGSKKRAGTSKIKDILCTVYKFYDFTIFSLDHFRTSIWDLLGLHFGAMLAPSWPNLTPSWLQVGSKSASRGFRRVPRGFPAAPRGSKKRSKRPPGDLQLAKTAPRALKEAPGAVLEPFWLHFGCNLMSPTTPRTYPTGLRRGAGGRRALAP